MSQPVLCGRLVSQGDSFTVAAASFGNSPVRIKGISINTGVASAVVHVFNAMLSTAGSKVAKIDATTAAGISPRTLPMFDLEGQTGLNVWLGGGDADVTIYYTVRI